MAGRSRTARRARSAVAAAILLGASLAVLLAAPPAHASGQVAEDVDGIWECAVAIAIVEDLGQTLAVSSSYVLDDFHAITEDSEALEESADAALRRYWTGLAAQVQSGGILSLNDYAESVADPFLREALQLAVASQGDQQPKPSHLGCVACDLLVVPIAIVRRQHAPPGRQVQLSSGCVAQQPGIVVGVHVLVEPVLA